MLNVIYSRADLIILSALAPPAAVGLFAVADRIIVAMDAAITPGQAR